MECAFPDTIYWGTHIMPVVSILDLARGSVIVLEGFININT